MSDALFHMNSGSRTRNLIRFASHSVSVFFFLSFSFVNSPAPIVSRLPLEIHICYLIDFWLSLSLSPSPYISPFGFFSVSLVPLNVDSRCVLTQARCLRHERCRCALVHRTDVDPVHLCGISFFSSFFFSLALYLTLVNSLSLSFVAFQFSSLYGQLSTKPMWFFSMIVRWFATVVERVSWHHYPTSKFSCLLLFCVFLCWWPWLIVPRALPPSHRCWLSVSPPPLPLVRKLRFRTKLMALGDVYVSRYSTLSRHVPMKLMHLISCLCVASCCISVMVFASRSAPVGTCLFRHARCMLLVVKGWR